MNTAAGAFSCLTYFKATSINVSPQTTIDGCCIPKVIHQNHFKVLKIVEYDRRQIDKYKEKEVSIFRMGHRRRVTVPFLLWTGSTESNLLANFNWTMEGSFSGSAVEQSLPQTFYTLFTNLSSYCGFCP